MADTSNHNAPDRPDGEALAGRSDMSQIRLRKPENFGDYQLLARLRVGGMAEVFRARRPDTEGELVAVKRILPSFTDEADYVSMFLDEARLAQRLDHEAIVSAHEMGQEDDTFFIVLEYVDGQDGRALIERAIERAEPLPVGLCCYLAITLCEALHYAHELTDDGGAPLGIVHRDVSPHNILISYDGLVKLTDFGVAKSADQIMKTQAGFLKGKHGYLSPEQASGEDLDRRSDLFSLGICLYELLTGERLFAGSSDYSTLQRVRKAEIPDITVKNAKVPPALSAILTRALQRKPADRYATAEELASELSSFMEEEGIAFGRANLASFMQEAFADERVRAARADAEAFGAQTDEVTGLAAFDDLDPPSAVSELAELAPEESGPPVEVPPAAPTTSAAPIPSPQASLPPGASAPPPPPPGAVREPDALDEVDPDELEELASAQATMAQDEAFEGEVWEDDDAEGAMDVGSAEVQSAELESAELESAELESAELESAELQSAELEPADAASAEAIDLGDADVEESAATADARDEDLADAEPAEVASGDVDTKVSAIDPEAAFAEEGAAEEPEAAEAQADTGETGEAAEAADELEDLDDEDVEGVVAAVVGGGSVPGHLQGSTLPGLGMDWDDEELATHVYDGDGADPAMPKPLPPVGAASPFPPVRPSTPPSVVPKVVPAVGQVRMPGAPSIRPPTPAYPTPSMAPGAAGTIPPAPAQRPALAWVVATVAAIVALIAGGLYLFREPATATVHLNTAPPDTTVTLDGKPVPGTSSPFVITDVAPGERHVLRVVKSGYAEWSTEFTPREGQVVQMPKVDLTPKPDVNVAAALTEPAAQPAAAPAAAEAAPEAKPEHAPAAQPSAAASPSAANERPRARASTPRFKRVRAEPKVSASRWKRPEPQASGAQGVLRINSRPWSQVTVDGRRIGNTPQMRIPVSPGKHTVVLVNPQFGVKKTLTLDVKAGETVTRIVTLVP